MGQDYIRTSSFTICTAYRWCTASVWTQTWHLFILKKNVYILSSAFSSVIFSPATSFLCKQPILHLHLIYSTVSLWCHRLSAWNNIWKLHLKWIFLKLQHRLLHCLVWNLSTQRYYIINWPFVLLLPLLFFSNSASPRPPPPPTLSVSDGAAIHGSEGPCQRAVDCGARSGGQKRSQHQVRDHYFLTYTRLVQSCVCVPFRGCPVPGPRPGVGHERRTPPRHLTGWKNKNKKIKLKKTSRPAPDSRACPLHDDVWRCVVSLFFLLVSSLFYFCSPPLSLAWATSSCLQGWRMTFEPRAVVHFCLHL